jgi:predicted negative regulator of RcsB-dependent stress response
MADKPENTPAEELGQAVVESDVASGAEAYIEKNKRTLILVICLVLLGSAAYIILNNVSKEKEREAANAFTLADTAEQFRQVSIDYQGTVAGGNALLMKADRETKEQNAKEATATLTEFVAAYQDHPRYAQGLFALAAQAQTNGDNDDAKRRFQEIVDTQSQSELAPLALMRLGDLALAAKNYEEARGIYNSVMPRFPANPFIQKVTQKISLLDLESPPPDLKKPEAPKVEADITPTPKPAPAAKTAPAEKPASAKTGPGEKVKPDAKPKAKAAQPDNAEGDPRPKAKAKKKAEPQSKAAPDSPAPDAAKKTDAEAPAPGN